MSIVLDGTTGITTPGLTNSGTDTLSSGTANGVAYLNGSKVLTTGSGLVFDGINVGIGTSSPATKLHINGGSQLIVDTTNPFLSIRETASGNSNRATFVADSVGMQLIADYGTNPIPMLFKTSNTERMRIDTSGNLGIGVTPSTWASPFKVIEGGDGSTYQSSLGFQTNNDTVSLNSNVYYNGSNYIYKYSKQASRFVVNKNEFQWFNAASGTAGNPITFTQAMTLGSDGQLMVGTTAGNSSAGGIHATGPVVLGAAGLYQQQISINSGQKIQSLVLGVGYTDLHLNSLGGNVLVGTTSSDSGAKMRVSYGASANGIAIQDTNNTSGTAFVIFQNSTPANIGTISRVGTTNAVAYNTTSDQRLKSNIEDALPVLEKLMQVQVRQYDWTEGDLHQDYGFIAQELQPLLTGIVTEGKTEEDMWQLDYSRLTPHLVKAIQEQQVIIQSLTNRITALEGATQ